ncbi:MAG: hypothetical protein JNM10_11270 [Planctomycetia bacterium]|nr:hypothetical protein [Planctomycetia bacterium]
MSTVAKVFVVLNFLLAALFLGSASALLGHSDHWKARHTTDTTKLSADLNTEKNRSKALESELSKTQADKTASDTAAAERKREAETLQTQNATLKEKFDSLLASHAAATRALQIAQNTIDNVQKLVGVLQDSRKTDIDNLTKALAEKNEAVKMQNALEANLNDATQQLKDVLAKHATTQTELQRALFELESYRKLYPNGPGTEQPWQVGKVLTADAANNIVVVSLGAEDGVKVGYRYAVSRGNQFIATITIMSTQAKMAAGKVTLGNGSPMPGDDIATSSTK